MRILNARLTAMKKKETRKNMKKKLNQKKAITNIIEGVRKPARQGWRE